MKSHHLPSASRTSATRPSRHQEAGFTMVEILVVIAIIAVLAMLSFRVAGNVQQRAVSATCMANQREIGGLFPVYAADNNGLYPFVYRADGEESGIEVWSVNLLAPYVFPNLEREAYRDKTVFQEDSIFRCPAARKDLKRRGVKFVQDERLGYGMNESLPGRGSPEDRYQAYSFKVPGNVETASQTCLLMDSHKSIVGSTHRTDVKKIIGRHNGKVNVLYFDGSNGTLDYDDIPFSGGGTPGADSRTNRFWFGTD